MAIKASDILEAAAGHMKDRADTYDNPQGERSMAATVDAYNSVTGQSVTAEQGWLFMAILKAVRSQQGGYRADNYEDGAAYFALAGEQAAVDRRGSKWTPRSVASDISWVAMDEDGKWWGYRHKPSIDHEEGHWWSSQAFSHTNMPAKEVEAWYSERAVLPHDWTQSLMEVTE